MAKPILDKKGNIIGYSSTLGDSGPSARASVLALQAMRRSGYQPAAVKQKVQRAKKKTSGGKGG